MDLTQQSKLNPPPRSCRMPGKSRPKLLQLPQYLLSGMTIQLIPTLNQQGNDLTKLHARHPLRHPRSALL